MVPRRRWKDIYRKIKGNINEIIQNIKFTPKTNKGKKNTDKNTPYLTDGKNRKGQSKFKKFINNDFSENDHQVSNLLYFINRYGGGFDRAKEIRTMVFKKYDEGGDEKVFEHGKGLLEGKKSKYEGVNPLVKHLLRRNYEAVKAHDVKH